MRWAHLQAGTVPSPATSGAAGLGPTTTGSETAPPIPRGSRAAPGNPRGHRIARRDVDRLRALLHEAEVHGPRAADRGGLGDAFPAHVRGLIAWVAQVHPARGARLRAQYERIDRTAGSDGAV